MLVSYSSYKPSNIDWLPAIPDHWSLFPGLKAFEHQKVPNSGLIEKTVLSLSYGRIVIKPVEKQHGLVPASYETYQIVERGNIIIRGTDLQNDKTSLRIGFAKNRGIITSAYLCFRVKPGVLPEFGYRLLDVYDKTKAIYKYGSGLRQNLDQGEIKRLPIFLPPVDEQAAIVRYLDHANRKIDKYVNSKKRLIKLLEEQKQAIIHKAVTRGIDPDAPMKDSGVDWLGQIPSHWDPVRNMALFSQRVESGIEGLTVLQVSLRSGISAEELDQFGRPKRLIADATKYKLIRKDDIAYNTMRLWQGAVGVSPSDGLVSPAYVVLKARSGVYPKYYDYLFHTEVYKQQVNRVSTGIVSDRNRCYWDSFKQIANVRVPLDEQKEIVQRIESETESVNQTIDRARKEIDLLNEYRTRLTADVVTGKLDVREAAKDLPDFEEEAVEEADEFELDEEELEAVED